MRNKNSRAGFALLQILVVLAIVGALIGFGIQLIKPETEQRQLLETQNRIYTIVEEVISWSIINGNLPDVGTFNNIVSYPDDSWGNPYLYIYDIALTTKPSGGICGRLTTQISGTTPNVAFAIISAGVDYQVASNPSTSGSFSGSLTISQNDFVTEITLENLKLRASCDRSTPGKIRIINTELPKACTGLPYEARIYGEGGVSNGGSYLWCVKGSLPAGLNPSTGCVLPSDCSSLLADETGWVTSSVLILSGIWPTAGDYSFSVFLRDVNDPSGAEDNCVEVLFTVTVLSSCP